MIQYTKSIKLNKTRSARKRMIYYLRDNGIKYTGQPHKVLKLEYERITGLTCPKGLKFTDWLVQLYESKSEFLPKAESRKKRRARRKKEYSRYLKTQAWKDFREIALNHYGRICTACGSHGILQVHHLHYKNIFNEKLEDVTILCIPCHKKIHNRDKKNEGSGK